MKKKAQFGFHDLIRAITSESAPIVQYLLEKRVPMTSSEVDDFWLVCKNETILKVLVNQVIQDLQLSLKLQQYTHLTPLAISETLDGIANKMVNKILFDKAFRFLWIGGKKNAIVRNSIIDELKSQMKNTKTDIGKALKESYPRNQFAQLVSFFTMDKKKEFYDLKKQLTVMKKNGQANTMDMDVQPIKGPSRRY